MKIVALAAALALTPLAAQAGEITLDKPMQGATLLGSETDMSVYFVQLGNQAYRVHAHYVTKANDGQPRQVVMELKDGEAASFALPGHKAETYSFSRSGNALHVRQDVPAPHGHEAS